MSKLKVAQVSKYQKMKILTIETVATAENWNREIKVICCSVMTFCTVR